MHPFLFKMAETIKTLVVYHGILSSNHIVHCQRLKDKIECHTKNVSEMRREAQFKKWFFEAISLVVIQSFRERCLCFVAIFGSRHFCVSNACALVVTTAKLILHCIQIYLFGTVTRLTRVQTAPLKFCAPVLNFSINTWEVVLAPLKFLAPVLNFV